jgi:hypothetical protein
MDHIMQYSRENDNPYKWKQYGRKLNEHGSGLL